jgi:hypothetical protein
MKGEKHPKPKPKQNYNLEKTEANNLGMAQSLAFASI